MKNNNEKSRKIKIISECFVKPSHVTNESPKEPHHLRALDVFMLGLNPMQKGLLFDSKTYDVRSEIVQRLKKAVIVSLVYFYPLAGRLATEKFHNEHKCSFYVDSNKGPGARFIHASVGLTISDILSSIDVPPIVKSFFDLGEESLNFDGHTRSLLSVQVTELIDGVFIGFTMNHCVADGTSLWHYISTLSEIFTQMKDNYKNKDEFNTIAISKKPFFSTLFPKTTNGPITRFPYLEPDEFISPHRLDPAPLRVRLFHFSSKSISNIKARANKECGLENNISSFQALCGLIWRSIIRAKNLQHELKLHFSIAINARTRLDPPLPPEYFRCFFVTSQCVSNVGNLLRGDGLGRAALSINQVIKGHDNQTTRTIIEQFEQHPIIFQPGLDSVYSNPNKAYIIGSAKFDTYGPEFGLGKAIAVRGGFVNMEDGQVVANPGLEGNGSVDLQVCLLPQTMSALELDEEFMSFVSLT